MIVVERAPPYLTVQDAGRPGFRASGVPRSGAMDLWSLALANAIVGNRRDAAALEWAIAGGALRFDRDVVIALVGAAVEAKVDEAAIEMNSQVVVRAGQTLVVDHFIARRFLYVAVAGGVDCPPILGSRSTYLPAGFGGIEGRRLARGDVVPIGAAAESVTPKGLGDILAAGPSYDAAAIRFIARVREATVSGDRGTGSTRDDFEVIASMLDTPYAVSAASDRTGYRLEAATPFDAAGESITSEPVCSGAIQLPPGGHPIVLMADSPTVGGYRILGTVISCDLPILAQCTPGRTFRFESVSVAVAQEGYRQREHALRQASIT